ncbi:MAG: hypothetical protein DBX51_02435 [Clostridiales bacterium]|nr:MAG: hypothetical protein DBX51_02435 [Clostridiales bacterium]
MPPPLFLRGFLRRHGSIFCEPFALLMRARTVFCLESFPFSAGHDVFPAQLFPAFLPMQARKRKKNVGKT